MALPILNHWLPLLVPGIISAHHTVMVLTWVPYWGLALAAFLGLQLNQTRISVSCLWILGTYFLFHQPDFFQGIGLSPTRCLEILGTTLPISLVLIFSFKESRFLSSETLFRFLLAFLPPVFLVSLLSVDAAGFQSLLFWKGAPLALELRIPQLAWLCAFILAVVFACWKEPKTRLFLGALTCALPVLGFALEQSLAAYAEPFAPLPLVPIILTFLAFTLVLLHAVFSLHWNRVFLDPLTGISNRQSLEDRLHTLAGPFTLAMMDIDHFKRFNDTYGHEEGDNVLRMVAEHLREHLGDRVYRYGGEEFCAIFEETDGSEALALVEAMRKKLEKRKFIIRRKLRKKSGDASGGEKISKRGAQITLSIGLACPNKKHPTYKEVLPWADQCLYQAKEKGRNRSVLADS